MKKIQDLTKTQIIDRYSKYNKLMRLYIPIDSDQQIEIYGTRNLSSLGGIYGYKESNFRKLSLQEAIFTNKNIDILMLHMKKENPPISNKMNLSVASSYNFKYNIVLQSLIRNARNMVVASTVVDKDILC